MFKVEEVTEEIINYIRNYCSVYNIKGVVIGISGGKDSGVVAGLFAKAIGPANVVGLWMPCHSKEEDKNNAYAVADRFGFEIHDIDLTDVYETYIKQYPLIYPEAKEEDYKDSNINIKPRLRMATLYYNAALLTRARGGLYIVPGTSNKCEMYVGYFTKGGDNVADVQVIADLTVDEVIKIGEYIGVPDQVIHKAPDDGLSGMTDEEKLGVKYSEIADVINGKEVDKDVKEKIMTLHNKNLHKFNTPIFKKG